MHPSASAQPTPSTPANARARRTHHGSTLLQSPPRPGHSAGMRNIFQTASQHNTPATLYPQLPNVSRKASQPRGATSHELTAYVPSLHQSDPLYPVAPSASSESWSDDTGYLVAGSRSRPSDPVIFPAERIAHWLSDVLDSDASDTSDPISLLQRQSTRVTVDKTDSRGIQTPSSKDDTELGPLSPNVCVERGPSRHRSGRKPRNAARGMYIRQSPLVRTDRLKENLDHGESDTSINESPIKPLLQARNRRLRLAAIVADKNVEV
jgi:hypothetical protein